MGVTSWGDTLKEARKKAYENVSRISFEGMQYRKDIAELIAKGFQPRDIVLFHILIDNDLDL